MKKRILSLFFAILLIFGAFAACTGVLAVDNEAIANAEVETAAEGEQDFSSSLPKPSKDVIISTDNDDGKSAFFATFDVWKKNFYNTFLKDARWKLFVEGFGNTVFIALCSTFLGILIGMVVALLKVFRYQSDRPGFLLKFFTWFCNLYTTLIRGTPAVVQLFIAYYIIFKTSDNYVLVSIFTFGINSGAYVSEVIRAGIMAVDRGQLEAGRSLGLSHVATMVNIILPQAFKNILPALGNEFILLLKDTSIAGYIGTIELMHAGNIVRSRTFEPYFSLFSVALVYLVCVIGLEQLLKIVERRLARSDRH